MLRTSAICGKADQDKGIIHITQDVVRAVQVLPGCSCAMRFAIQAMFKQCYCMYEHIYRWMSWMLLAVLTSDLIASFVRGLTV